MTTPAVGTYVDVVFDGPPDHEAGRFVEVEKADGSGVKLGNWVQRDDGYWALRITREDVERALCDTAEPTEAEVEVGAKEIWRWFVGSNLEGFYRHAYAYDREKCMDACRAALKAAAEARR